MKSNMQRKGNTALTPGRHFVGTSKLKKGTNRQRGPGQIASGVLPFSAAEVLRRQLSVSEPCIGTRKEVTALEMKSEEVDPLTKIKLQLFPVDEVTRIGLEKDGLNPFLELTLRARKKISSVIKHIHTKWGGSSIAIGEPILLPYDAHLRHPVMSRRWTSKDTFITAGDVYTAVETPAIFRLSYGWFSDHEPQRGSALTALRNCIQSESMQKEIENTEERNCLSATAEVAVSAQETEVKMGHSHEWSNSPQDDDMTKLRISNELKSSESRMELQPISDISIGGMLSEASLQGINGSNNVEHHQQTQIQWDDSLTALSIGGLLSEASLQAKINNNNSNSNNNKSNPKSNETTFICDSFDAAINSSSLMKTNLKPSSSLDSKSSILDAEETCHAFAFRKFSSSNKNVRVSARASQDMSSNSFKFPHLIEQVDKQAIHAEDNLPRPQQYSEDSRSLGLRGITWNESLDPFDLGWKVSGVGNV